MRHYFLRRSTGLFFLGLFLFSSALGYGQNVSTQSSGAKLILDRAIETMLLESKLEAIAYGYGQNKQDALNAAYIVASNELLQRIEGIKIDSHTVVKKGVSEMYSITASSFGEIRGHNVVERKVKINTDRTSERNKFEAEVKVRIKLSPDVAQAIDRDLHRSEQKHKPAIYRFDSNRFVSNQLFALEAENQKLTAQITKLMSSTSPEDQLKISELMSQRMKLLKGIEQLEKTLGEQNIQIENLRTELEKLRRNSASKPYTGLIIDARGKHLGTGIAPKIYTEVDRKLRQIYGFTNAPDSTWFSRGLVNYAQSVKSAESDLQELIGTNPLVVQAIQGYGNPNRIDVIVSNEDAVKIFKADLRDLFLEQRRVVFVIGNTKSK